VRPGRAPAVGHAGPGSPRRASPSSAPASSPARPAHFVRVRADPDRMDALNDLAVAFHLEGRFEAARQLLDEVVARGTPQRAAGSRS